MDAGSDDERVLRDHVIARLPEVMKEPAGLLVFPYIVPGGFYSQLWDWDAVFCGIGTLPFGGARFLAGSMQNFLHLANAETGEVPGCLTPKGASPTLAHAKPVIISTAWIAARESGDYAAFRPYDDKMRALLRFWDTTRTHAATGLPVWHDTMECGADDIPWAPIASAHTPGWDAARDADTLSAPDVVTFLVREHTAMALFLERWALDGSISASDAASRASSHRARVEELRVALNAHLWHWEAGAEGASRRGWYIGHDTRSGTPYVRRTYQAAWPLWAHLEPSAEAAHAAIATILSDDLMAAHGIRSTSNADPAYTLQDVITPYSNWRGPVWINVNVVLAYTLAAHGKKDEALVLARRLVAMLARDIRKSGGMHECYDGDSGEPLASKSLHFLSWNILVATLCDNLRQGVNPLAL